MPGHIQAVRKLLVVSDTVMLDDEQANMGFEPVVRELDVIADLFEEIIWLGYGYAQTTTPVVKPFSSNIRLVTMPRSGGNGLISKMRIVFQYPIYFFLILKHLRGATHVHTRAPSHPALLAILISKWDKGRIYWHKYAGNWIEPNPPPSYAYQRRLLSSINNSNVFGTINGYWPDQNKQLLPFENPCIKESERAAAQTISIQKDFTDTLSILFVGLLSPFKGIVNLIKALELLTNPGKFSELIIVGNGVLWNELNLLAAELTRVRIILVGSLNRLQIAGLYEKAHIIVLPSLSEGFPKVIGEGVSYGCIPVVTNISSVDQYIQHGENGYLIENNLPETIALVLNEISINSELKRLSINATLLSTKFTYEYYKERIVNEIL